MRKRFVVSYDVADPKRLRLVYRKMRGFGDVLQFSVFLCELSPKELAIMNNDLSELINHNEDRVMIIDVGPATGRGSAAITTLGKQIVPPGRQSLVV